MSQVPVSKDTKKSNEFITGSMKSIIFNKVFFVTKVTFSAIAFLLWGFSVSPEAPIWFRLIIGFGIGFMGGSIAPVWIQEGQEIWKDREVEGFLKKHEPKKEKHE